MFRKLHEPSQRAVTVFINGVPAPAEHGETIAAGVRVLFGGSVKADNVGEIVAQTDVDGALVGGASLDADGFSALCRASAPAR